MKQAASIQAGSVDAASVCSSTPSTAILERNLSALAGNNPDLAQRIAEAECRELALEVAADGHPTGTWQGRRLASRHQPGEEALRLVSEVEIRDVATVCVLGFGLGLHVETLARRIRRSGSPCSGARSRVHVPGTRTVGGLSRRRCM